MNILTVSDAARLLGVCVPTVRNWVKAGKLSAMRTPGGQRLFLLDDVQRIAREREGAK